MEEPSSSSQRGLKSKIFRRSIRTPIALLLGASLMLAACSSGSNPGDSNAGGRRTLTVGILTAPVSLDPGTSAGIGLGAITMMPLAFDTLLTLNKDGTIGPGLAKSFGYINNSEVVFDLALRQEARFSDGQPVTATAVKTWMDYYATTPRGKQSSLSIKSVEAVDPATVRITLNSPNPELPFLLATVANGWGDISSPDTVKNPQGLASATVGAGKYKIDSATTVAGQQYTFVPNSFYFDKSTINFDKVVVNVVPNPSSMLQTITARKLDVAQGDLTTAASAEQSGLTVTSAPALYNGIFFLDRSGSVDRALADPRVRQAMNYGVNRTALNAAINQKFGTPTDKLLTLDGQNSGPGEAYPFDTQKAKALLTEAGYSNGLNLKLLCNASDNASLKNTCQAVAQNYRDIGISLQVVTPPTADQTLNELKTGTYPLLLTDYPISSTWHAYKDLLAKDGPFNQHGWNDPVIDDQAKAGASGAPGSSNPAWSQLVQRTVQQADFVPLFTSSLLYYYRSSDLAGVSISSPVDFNRALIVDWARK